jgi:glycosyltransferase Alg8
MNPPPASGCLRPSADLARWPGWREKWTARVLWWIGLYFAVCCLALAHLPNTIWDPDVGQVVLVIGLLGIWRYAWWLTHWVRARIYGRSSFPRLRRRADAVWRSGWRPRHLHVLLTTFQERPDITEMVIQGICGEVRACGVPATVWLGSAERPDEDAVVAAVERHAGGLDLTLRIVRQNRPGKRIAMGLILRAMSRGSLRPDDFVVFVDGDFVMLPGAVAKCLPLFAVLPDLEAVTTDEEVSCRARRWVNIWLALRFAQRRVAMQSHALSGRVLTLTGRMSVFRARHLTRHAFIRTIEADHLDHWLWGRFRFLSGDDKSTWYFLLKEGARMLYVPDAVGHTVEVFDGRGYRRMRQNLQRWSGNMLRNGARAIALGPRRMPLFIWWCLIDQRIAMWTMLVSPILAVSTAILRGAEYLVAYVVFVAISRMLLSLLLFSYSRRIYVAYPLFLYLNQLLNAAVKVHLLSRLAQQRWANRGEQSAGIAGGGLVYRARCVMASYATLIYVSLLVICVVHGGGLVDLPSSVSLSTLLYEISGR